MTATLLAMLIAGQQALTDWVEGHWHDPVVHRCGEVWLRITVKDGRYTLWQMTYGRQVRASGGEILTEGRAGLIVRNEGVGQTQRIRYVSRNAHVVERPDGSGGITYVRCPEGSIPPTS